jgi:hypothetical protein
MDMDKWTGRHEYGDMDMDMNRRRPVSIILRRCYVRNQQSYGDMDMETWRWRHGDGDMDIETLSGRHGHGHGDRDM